MKPPQFPPESTEAADINSYKDLMSSGGPRVIRKIEIIVDLRPGDKAELLMHRT